MINLSFGNNYGSHSGDSLLETYLNAVSNLGQNVICIGAGNEGDTGRHYTGNLKSDRKRPVRRKQSVRHLIRLRRLRSRQRLTALSPLNFRSVLMNPRSVSRSGRFMGMKSRSTDFPRRHPLRHALSCPRHGASDAWSDRTSPVLWHAIPPTARRRKFT